MKILSCTFPGVQVSTLSLGPLVPEGRIRAAGESAGREIDALERAWAAWRRRPGAIRGVRAVFAENMAAGQAKIARPGRSWGPDGVGTGCREPRWGPGFFS